MMRRWFLLAALPWYLACKPDKVSSIQAWLGCDECVGQELWNIRRLGDDAVPTLADALIAGPSVEQVNHVTAQINSDLATGDRFRSRNPGPAGPIALTPDQLRAQYIESYKDTYRRRALIGLDRINTAASIDTIKAIRARDSVQPFPWSPAIRELVRAYAFGVTDISLAPFPHLSPGQSTQGRARVRVRGNPQYALLWTSGDAALVTVTATGLVTVLVAAPAGSVPIKVCVDRLMPDMCATAVVKIP